MANVFMVPNNPFKNPQGGALPEGVVSNDMKVRGFPADGFPELYPLGDTRFSESMTYSTQYRGGGRMQTRKNIFTRPPYAANSKGPMGESLNDMRPAGVGTAKFSDINMNNLVGYKDQYWKEEVMHNHDRKKVHNIVNNILAEPEPFRAPRMVPIQIPLQKLEQKGNLINYQAMSYRQGY